MKKQLLALLILGITAGNLLGNCPYEDKTPVEVEEETEIEFENED
jgi:hypothetical protein